MRAIRMPVALMLLGVWALLIAVGFGWMSWHQSTAGVNPTLLLPLPSMNNNDGPTLVMFAHPCCSCTRASLQQLEHLLAHAPALRTVRVVFLHPTNADSAWEKAPLVNQARRISRLQIEWRTEADLDATYGALTSGHVILWGSGGELLFSGGITNSRGHEGPSVGVTAILAHLRGEPAAAQTPVYGCSLLTPRP